MSWVSVKDRLPPMKREYDYEGAEVQSEEVLLFMGKGRRAVGFCSQYPGEKVEWHEIREYLNVTESVTHWRELPPDPEEP